ncbi:MAG: NAD(P)-binding protein [Dehalococcoidia bacterium]
MSGNGSKPDGKVGAVMVVGGGICGMQTSLDLANSGFKVYMVEETTSIGGRMAQLDKTFPTNDCSMCMISPKLIEVDKHLNIEIISNSEVQALEGEEGNLTARVLKKPRYIDVDKCSACGDCVDVCPITLPNEFEQGLITRKATYKRYPQAIPSANAITKRGTAPCKVACPAHISAQGYVALVAQGKYQEAVNLVREEAPFPGVLGRVCTHPCETDCTRGKIDQSISICRLKRFISDQVKDLGDGGLPERMESKNKKVAIIGSGPAGLTAGYFLSLWGYNPTVFEALPVAGGMMAVGIPSYRLPRDILSLEIDFIKSAGVEIRTNTPIGDSLKLNDLKDQGYESVFVATGAHRNNPMGVDGEDIEGVIPGVEFLRDVSLDKHPKIGNRVAVIGGGNVAIDAVRTAVRLGAKEAFILYRRSRDEMPANLEEIEETEEEGIEIRYLVAPNKIIGKDGKVTGIECVQMELSEPDESGRRRPVRVEGSEFTLDVDTIIPAIGQSPDLSFLNGNVEIKCDKRSRIEANYTTLETNIPGVFAGGDVVLGPATVVQAIAAGKQAAISIDRYLQGEDIAADRAPEFKPVEAPLEGVRKQPREKPLLATAEERKADFREVTLALSEEQAQTEANRCLKCGLCCECYQCVSVCQAKAIDHTMKEEILNLNVGSVVLAPGFKPYDPGVIKGDYGYGRAPNVVTGLEFERILSASGPFEGQVLRPSDGKHPVKVAWIQCVGSRKPEIGKDYCSSVCCMYATKQAVIAREHDERIQPTIFNMDIRAFGKGFERYYVSAQENFGVSYVQSMPSPLVRELGNGNLLLEYMTEDGQGKTTEEFDMIVLSVGLEPSESSVKLAQIMGIETDRFGFCKTDEFNPNRTSKAGVYVAGAFDAPMDIPESVMNGSSAAYLASAGIKEARGTLVSEKEFPPEKDVWGQEPRIGVFVCRCGANIARVVDVPSVVDYARTLPHVVHADENLYTCSTDTQAKIIDAVEEHGLNRVVVASCTPRTHEPLFQETCREAGLNKFLFEMANIRDQCSWVHATHPHEASVKAKDLVRMAVARAAELEPLYEYPQSLYRTGVVLGGGAAGMKAALGLAEEGYDVIVVEREQELGGMLRELYYTETAGSDPQALMKSLIEQVENNTKITVYKGAELKEFGGFVGNYHSVVRTTSNEEVEIDHGVVILATGAVEYKPEGEYLYGQSDSVLTQHELEVAIGTGELDASGWNSVVMVQCVGSREPEHNYCSRICCTQAIKNALKLKEANPDMNIYVLYRDIRTYAMKELAYEEARNKGVLFIRYEAENKPEVIGDDGNLKVKVFDPVYGEELSILADKVILSSGVRPQPDAHRFASKLKLPLTADGFYMEAHMKLRPLDFVNDGMYLAGLAHSPKFISESLAQAQGAASRAVTVLSQPHLTTSGVVSVVDEDKCVACLTCVRACPFGVPRFGPRNAVVIEAAACQGCGICVSVCPRKAITLQNYKDAQVMAKTAVLCEV